MALVDVLWIARYDYPQGWSLCPHDHDYFQLILFLGGNGEFTLGSEVLEVRPGELYLIRPGESHGLVARTLVRTLDVKFRVAPGQFSRQLRRPPLVMRTTDLSIATRLEQIRMEGEGRGPYFRELCGAILTEVLCQYLRQGVPAASKDPGDKQEIVFGDAVLARAVECIKTRHHERLTVRDLSRAAGCTDRTLRLHFRAAGKLSPLAYLQRHRVTQAKLMMQYSGDSLKEIAERVGFQTVHHFTRHFTAAEGKSPAVWRRRYLEGVRKDVYIDPGFHNRILTVEA